MTFDFILDVLILSYCYLMMFVRHYIKETPSFKILNGLIMYYFIIALLLILMFISLGYSLFAMIKDDGNSTRNVKGLTIRVGIWALLFLFIVAGVYTGKINPSNSIEQAMMMQKQGK